MTRRHETLVPLTHDHHHTLAQARRLRDAAKTADVTERRNTANDFINFYFGRAIRHFHEEEELFFAPLIDIPEARDSVLRALSDHLRLHADVRKLKRQVSAGDADDNLMNKIATLLTEHVRFEEQDLFPLVERLVPEEELRDLAVAGRRDV